MEVVLLKIDQILILDRERKDMGDLEALADSISELGQISPILVTRNCDANTAHKYPYILLCGERRLRAIRDILNQKLIAAEFRACSSPQEMLAWEVAENLHLPYSEEEFANSFEHFENVRKSWGEMDLVEIPVVTQSPFMLVKK